MPRRHHKDHVTHAPHELHLDHLMQTRHGHAHVKRKAQSPWLHADTWCRQAARAHAHVSNGAGGRCSIFDASQRCDTLNASTCQRSSPTALMHLTNAATLSMLQGATALMHLTPLACLGWRELASTWNVGKHQGEGMGACCKAPRLCKPCKCHVAKHHMRVPRCQASSPSIQLP